MIWARKVAMWQFALVNTFVTRNRHFKHTAKANATDALFCVLLWFLPLDSWVLLFFRHISNCAKLFSRLKGRRLTWAEDSATQWNVSGTATKCSTATGTARTRLALCDICLFPAWNVFIQICNKCNGKKKIVRGFVKKFRRFIPSLWHIDRQSVPFQNTLPHR